MAKKGKTKKSGMEKRRHDKRHRKMVKRKKLMSHRSPAQITSPHQLEKLLKTLPNLAFDPMLQDLYLDEKMMQELIDQGLEEPQILSRLLTPEFLEELGRRLEDVEDSAVPQSPKALLAKASRHQLEHSEEIPHLSNPLLFAFFLKTRAMVEGNPMKLADLASAIRDFEERNADWIAEASENPELLKNEVEEEIETPKEDLEPAVFSDEIMQDLEKDLEGLSQQRADRMREDLELFLEDFGPPPLEQWTSSMVDQFFLEWFVEHANPTDEDRLSMRETMLHLFKFLRVRKMLGEDFSPGSLQESEPTSPESQRTVA
ncbi:MAG: hypothetical protein QF560_08135 [SAR324 cluster bacterium]|jgi:hypothetical protein|nr:hypothetical protein [Deltaproteobacteria bacterium]MDP6092234.1 hypothetical protein [SAR324 cluster bacterium]MDP7138326.1 hypothetical protein [SAR324 cluster bacterium]MDP7333429.1 hypothetical protein [SAR324 cluster bacterium]MDP7500798.1 hypothetical protein [SAR324 cluster bacterium]|tara:strand:- start:2138 stop:3085 length:948 start_codon:yes stop_codon:yes gene_type:complete